jgi:hypothetical protein
VQPSLPPSEKPQPIVWVYSIAVETRARKRARARGAPEKAFLCVVCCPSVNIARLAIMRRARTGFASAALLLLLAPESTAAGDEDASVESSPLDGVFNNRTEMGDWAPYFESVYGVDTMVFPFNMSQLNMFYRSRLPPRVAARLPAVNFVKWSTKPNPIYRGDLYCMFSKEHIFRCELDVCSTKDPSSACAKEDYVGSDCPARGRSFNFSDALKREAVAELQQQRRRRVHEADAAPTDSPSALQPPPQIHNDNDLPGAGVANNIFVEVIHSTGDPAGSGFWFYFAKGSGVYLNVSRTMPFRRHVDSWAYFKCKDTDCNHYDPKNALRDEELTVSSAARHGIDTLQYTRFVENGAIKQEIVMTRVNTVEASSDDKRVWDRPCPPAEFLQFLRGGFGASKPCTCDQSKAKGDVSCLQSVAPVPYAGPIRHARSDV